jgi:hypothetical protein
MFPRLISVITNPKKFPLAEPAELNPRYISSPKNSFFLSPHSLASSEAGERKAFGLAEAAGYALKDKHNLESL